MSKLILLLSFFLPFSLVADQIDQYKYYQTDNIIPNKRSPYYAAFLKIDDPCLFVKDFRKNEIQEYCQMEDSGLDLRRDYPSIYPVDMTISGLTLYFIVAAPLIKASLASQQARTKHSHYLKH